MYWIPAEQFYIEYFLTLGLKPFWTKYHHSFFADVINYGFLTTETNSKAFIYFVVKTTSSESYLKWLYRNFTMAEMTSLHMYLFTNFVYNCVFRKDEKKPHETFPISKKNFTLKMNANLKKELCFENERKSQKRTMFWKWTHILKKKYILKMFLEKWKAINHF